MKVLVAPDKFKGTASAAAVAEAAARGASAAGAQARCLPMADGGEGTLEALGGPNRETVVTGPLGDPVTAAWRLQRSTAVVEMAAASGLALVGGPDGNDPVAASTAGTGELIVAAVEAGARQIIVGVGGSATTDGGFGALRAMYPLPRLRGTELIVACDVRTRFLDAAAAFGPQKGATPAQVEFLRRRLERLAQVYADEYGIVVVDVDRSGAAGGLAGGLLAAGATLVDGFDLVADHLDLYEAIEAVDLVITGEGFLDEESFHGKVVGGVHSYAQAAGVDVLAVVGQAFDGASSRLPTLVLADEFGLNEALAHPEACIEQAVRRHLGAT
ncbi:MAG: glycerate kinase [Acidimicrobiia bacterium]|nr:glycerate kinase [Acidimicrobiia bacterium]MDH5236190.1 glycerate kinase [Acidimicrobiia bacterium]